MNDLDVLGARGRLGPIVLRNRCVIPAHTMQLGDGRGEVPPQLHAYAVERAHGGAALIGLESVPVARETRTALSSLAFFDDLIIPSLSRLAVAVHAAGAAVSATLWHGGHHVPHQLGAAPVAASAIPSFITGDVPRALGGNELPQIISCYAAAAARCRRANLDSIEVQTASDYLLGSFLSPRLNRRTDSYGGSIENRVRLVSEVLAAVRAAAGFGIAVGIRTSVAHAIPGDPRDYDIEDSLAAIAILAERGLTDFVSLLDGSHWSMDRMIPAMGTNSSPLAGAGRKFKKRLQVPVIVSGRVRTAAAGAALIRDGSADFVGMVRTWICEPRWFSKLASGESAQIRPCISCNQGCLGFVSQGFPGTCVLNVRAGRELTLSEPVATQNPRDFDVVGGGPAGLEAARILALRGHKVRLFEATGALGGQMRWASEAPGRDEVKLALNWWQREVARLGVQVIMNSRVSLKSTAASSGTVWAIGAVPGHSSIWRSRPYLVDGIPGGETLKHGREIWRGDHSPSGHVAVIDEEGGWPAFSLVESLLALPNLHLLTLVTTERTFGERDMLPTFEVAPTRQRLLNSKLCLLEGATVERIADATIELSDGRRLGPFDQILMSTGTVAPQLPDQALAVGDCVAPRSWWAAVHDAYELAMRL